MSDELQTVSLNLDGNFASSASSSASAAESLASGLDKAAAAGSKLKVTDGNVASRLQQERAVQQAILAAQRNAAASSAAFDLRAHELRLVQIKSEAAVRIAAAKQAATATPPKPPKPPAQAKAEAGIGDSFLHGLLPGADRLGTAAGIAGVAGGLVAAGAEKLLDAALALAKGAADLAVSAGQLALAQTSKREVQGAVLGKLGGDYEATVKMALKMGIDPDVAINDTKKLLNAKFAASEIPVLLRIKAGMDMAGLDGDALLHKLETIKLEPKVKSSDIDKLGVKGLDTKAIYAELAKELGVTVPQAMAKVKAGAVDSEAVVKAIEAVAGTKFGPLADVLGNSLPGLLARVRGGLMELFSFDPAVLDPIKSALKSVAEVMNGPTGQALKTALQEVFSAVADLFGGINVGDVKAFLTPIIADFKEIAETVRANSGGLKEFGKAAASISGDAIHVVAVALELVIYAAAGAGIIFRSLVDTITAVDEALDALSLDSVSAKFSELGDSVEDAISGALADALGLGQNLVDGLVQGIEGGASAAIDAATKMATDALDAAKQALGVASPSQEFAEVGGYSAEGMAQGMEGHPGPAAAGKKMAQGALEAAQGAAGGSTGAGAAGAAAGGAGGPGGAGGSGVTVNITVAGGGGGGGAAKEWQALLPVIEAAVRRIDRDRHEGARP